MAYSELQHKLIRLFTGMKWNEKIPDSNIELFNCSFHSDVNQRKLTIGENTDGRNVFFRPASVLQCNQDFTYPVFRPNSGKASKSAIILMHGLNERAWDKYLSWGYALAGNTGKTIIMFPLAYHMNRSPEAWRNPRNMQVYVKRRLINFPRIKELSIANVALSERLTRQPQRLFLSGYQAADDLIHLTKQIKSGEHELFNEDSSVDFFSYSISVFLNQILLLANPDNLYDQSRFFFFCGGSVLSAVHGISKYILDSKAFETLRSYYNRHFEQRLKEDSLLYNLIYETNLGRAFRTMLSFERLSENQKNIFKKFGDQIKTITLRGDKVIPSQLVAQTLAGSEVKEWDFNYNYTHENPFPVLSLATKRPAVDRAFDSLLTEASAFLD